MANIKQKTEEVYSNIKTNIRTILLNIAIVATAVVYIFYNVLKLEPTNLNPFILIAQSILAIIAALCIKTGLGENGIIRGYASQIWIDAKAMYNVKADKALPYIDKADEFYEKERIEKRIRNRKVRLSSYRMKYETFFDDNGEYIEHDIWTPHQKKKHLKLGHELPESVIVLDFRQRLCLRKCIKLQIYVKNMFNEYGADLTDDERKEKTDKMQRQMNFRKNFFSAIGFSIAGVYFIPTLMFNWGSIIWALFQVLMWVMFGLLDAYDNYSYITNEKVGLLKLKEQMISRFMIWIIGRDEFTKQFIEKPKQEEIKLEPTNEPIKEIVVEMTSKEAKAKGLL